MHELHAQIENEWRQVCPAGGKGTSNPWSVERKFLIGRAKVPVPWTSLLMIERHCFGGEAAVRAHYQHPGRTTLPDYLKDRFDVHIDVRLTPRIPGRDKT